MIGIGVCAFISLCIGFVLVQLATGLEFAIETIAYSTLATNLLLVFAGMSLIFSGVLECTVCCCYNSFLGISKNVLKIIAMVCSFTLVPWNLYLVYLFGSASVHDLNVNDMTRPWEFIIGLSSLGVLIACIVFFVFVLMRK